MRWAKCVEICSVSCSGFFVSPPAVSILASFPLFKSTDWPSQLNQQSDPKNSNGLPKTSKNLCLSFERGRRNTLEPSRIFIDVSTGLKGFLNGSAVRLLSISDNLIFCQGGSGGELTYSNRSNRIIVKLTFLMIFFFSLVLECFRGGHQTGLRSSLHPQRRWLSGKTRFGQYPLWKWPFLCGMVRLTTCRLSFWWLQWGQGLCYTLTQNLDYDETWEPCRGRPTTWYVHISTLAAAA